MGLLVLLISLVPFMAHAQDQIGQRVRPKVQWPIDVYVDFRLVDSQPGWPRRLLEKIERANSAIQTRSHEFDVACPVEVTVRSVAVYRVGEDGFVEGGGSINQLRMPYDANERPPVDGFPESRLYLAPGPGWAFSRVRENASYAWVGKWEKGSRRGIGGGTEGLVDPWGRFGGWVVAHELGHLTGAHHRVVTRPEDCSFMSYGAQMFPVRPVAELCPGNAARMVQGQCDAWLKKARKSEAVLSHPADLDLDGDLDSTDVALLRAILSGGDRTAGPEACLDRTEAGPCQLFPRGDANRDLRLDALDLATLVEMDLSGEERVKDDHPKGLQGADE